MIDRLEELLELLTDEDEREEEEREEEEREEEEGEDVPAPIDTAVLGPGAPGTDGGEAVPSATSGDELWDAPADPAAETGRFAAKAAEDGAVSSAEDRRDGPEWRLEAGAVPSAEAAWRRKVAEWTDEANAQSVRTAAEGAAGAVREQLGAARGETAARVAGRERPDGLEGLYRQTVQASRPAAPQSVSVERSGRTLRMEEPGWSGGLTVDELDRAVRRDSRRYDGGMTIY